MVQAADASANTGTWKAAAFVFPLTGAEFQGAMSITINLVPYLTQYMHQTASKSTTITNNFTGTCYLLTVLGGFVADSYFGTYWTIAGGTVVTALGLGLLTFSASYSGLQPAACEASKTISCTPATAHYMVPLYVALYTIAVGIGAVRPNTAAVGADQFDDSSPIEQKQGVRFFVWFYFFSNLGLLVAFSLGVYIQDDVSRGWGYGFSLMLYVVAVVIFVLGTPHFRHKAPGGSFLTRLAQVFVAALRKVRATLPQDSAELYNAPLPGSTNLHHSKNLRFLDKASVIQVDDRDALHSCQPVSGWRLCSVTQVEESKRILQMLPIWATTAMVSIVFSQLATFTVLAGSTLDRKLGPHFVVPAPSLNVIVIIFSLIMSPLYDQFFVPIVRKFTKHPYGFTTLQRLAAAICFAIMTMSIAALVEGRRLKDVRRLELQELPLGTFVLPMKMWWLVPQFFMSSQMELFLFISQYQFFYHEASDATRSIASSFTYSASAMGYYMSSLLVDAVNAITRRHKGGSWLDGQLNNGGLQKFYWLLAALLTCDLCLFLGCAHKYKYKYDWYHIDVATLPNVEGAIRKEVIDPRSPSPARRDTDIWELQ